MPLIPQQHVNASLFSDWPLRVPRLTFYPPPNTWGRGMCECPVTPLLDGPSHYGGGSGCDGAGRRSLFSFPRFFSACGGGLLGAGGGGSAAACRPAGTDAAAGRLR